VKKKSGSVHEGGSGVSKWQRKRRIASSSRQSVARINQALSRQRKSAAAIRQAKSMAK